MREEYIPCKISSIIFMVGAVFLFLSINIEILFADIERAQRGIIDVISYSSLYIAAILLVPSVPLMLYLCKRPEERGESRLCEILPYLVLAGGVSLFLSMLVKILRGEVELFHILLSVSMILIVVAGIPFLLACIILKQS